ncbi:class I SAM-dependent methyltransferase [Fulvivirga sp.]|uniref:class I SAM-dependent methyltransferase n=1 Tax=Fulvivirga sp. TaxID=1931237 RepID=UPI0032EB53FA
MSTKVNNNEFQQCIGCNSESIVPLKGYQKYDLVKCKHCKLIFVKKIPSELELKDHYSVYGYSNDQYISPITVKRYHDLLNKFEKYRRTNKIIDVGCGTGHFLVEAKKRGWEVYGTEYSEQAVRLCEGKGIKMHRGILNQQSINISDFDIVTSFEVIEHINNPQSELPNIHSLLRKGGLFYCTTPNFNALERYLTKENYSVINYPEHLSYYTKRSLHIALKRNGFKQKKILTSGVSLTYLKKSMGKETPRVNSPDSSDEKLRSKMEKSNLKFMKYLVNFGLNIFSIGSTIKCWYEKN